MHYQIYRFTRYLLVYLIVPEFFGTKVYPNITCVPWTHPSRAVSKLANTFLCQLLRRRRRNLETGTGPMHLTPLMPQKTVTPLRLQPSVSLASTLRLVVCQHCFFNNNCTNWGLIFMLNKQNQPNKLLSTLFSVVTFSPMDVDSM